MAHLGKIWEKCDPWLLSLLLQAHTSYNPAWSVLWAWLQIIKEWLWELMHSMDADEDGLVGRLSPALKPKNPKALNPNPHTRQYLSALGVKGFVRVTFFKSLGDFFG